MRILELPYKLQPNAWSCGPSALHNAFLSIRERHSIKKLCALSGATADDCPDVPGLKKAAAALGFVLSVEQHKTDGYTAASIRAYSKHKTPVLACVDRDKDGPYAHWIAIIRANKKHVWVADSSRPPPALMRFTWQKFMARLAAVHGPNDVRYDLFPLVKVK